MLGARLALHERELFSPPLPAGSCSIQHYVSVSPSSPPSPPLPAGPRSIQQIFRAAVFVFLPTSFELIAVCTVLTRTFSPVVGALVGATFTLYIIWSVTLTQVRVYARGGLFHKREGETVS